MQFIKKNFEKILLAIVLVGLVAVAIFMVFLVQNEKDRLSQQRDMITRRNVKPLDPISMTAQEELLKRAGTSVAFFYSDNTNKLFNPVRWQRTPDGRIIKNPAGGELSRLEITAIRPLYFIVSLDRVENYSAGPRYGFIVEHQAQGISGTRIPVFRSVGESKEYSVRGGVKENFALLKAEGTGDDVVTTVQLGDMDSVPVTKAAPYKRIEGYVADLKYTPDNKPFNGRREGNEITIAGEQYSIDKINATEVVLKAKSNQKNWPIKYNARER